MANKDITRKEMSEWLHKHIIQEPLIVRAILKEIGYGLDDDVIFDDYDTKEDDLYDRSLTPAKTFGIK